MKCHKCGCTDKELIHHHKSYNPEIIVMMCKPCHTKLHQRLRKENQCTIPSKKLEELSHKSKSRKNLLIEYIKQHCDNFHFYETMMPQVQLHEQIQYNYKTGNVSCITTFKGNNGKKLYYVDR